MSNAFTRSTMSKEEMKEREESLKEKEKAILELKQIAFYHLNRMLLQSSTYGDKLTKEEKLEAELNYMKICKKIDDEATKRN